MRTMKHLTATQRDNIQEWLDSRKEATGATWTESIVVFNDLDPVAQQYVITRRWYRASDGQRINRPLIPQSK